MVLANDRYLFSSFPEPRAFENVHDSCKNVRCVHDDSRGSLRQRQSFPQQHPRRGRRAVHQRSVKLTSSGGEQTKLVKNYLTTLLKIIL